MARKLVVLRSTLCSRAALLSLVSAGLAHAAGAQTLTDSLVSAYQGNPQLLAQRANLRATDELVPQALSNWRPVVSAGASVGWERLRVEGPGGTASVAATNLAATTAATAGGVSSANATSTNNSVTGVSGGSGTGLTGTGTTASSSAGSSGANATTASTAAGGVTSAAATSSSGSQTVATNSTSYFQPYTAQIQATQPVYRGGRTEAQTRQAENLVRAGRAQTLATEQQVLLNAVTIYMNTLRDQVTLELNIANEQVLGRQLESVQAQFQVGTLTRTDTSQAESSLASATASRVAAEGTLESDRATFQRIVGLPVVKLTYPVERPRVPATRVEAVTLAEQRNPSIIQSQFAEAAARANVSLQRGQLLPTLTVQGSAVRGYETSVAGVTAKTVTGTVQATIPIYEGGLYYSQTRQATQTVTQRRNDTETNRRSSVEQAISAWENWSSTRQRLIALQAAVTAAQVALTGTQQEQAVGARTVLDVLIAEQTLFSAKVNYVAAQRDEIVFQYTLAAATGQLTADDLSLPVQKYDMERNYRLVRNKWYGFGVASDEPNQEPSRQPGQPGAPLATARQN